jgi:hypothetical protein
MLEAKNVGARILSPATSEFLETMFQMIVHPDQVSGLIYWGGVSCLSLFFHDARQALDFSALMNVNSILYRRMPRHCLLLSVRDNIQRFCFLSG